MPQYKRWLSNYFIGQLQGKYSFLINCNNKTNRYKYDVQFRPNNTIMIYYGGTCLLTITCNDNKQQIDFSSKSYSIKHRTEFNEILAAKSRSQIKKACLIFLDVASSKASRRWNEEGSEGYCEQRISKLWGGQAWQEYMEMLVIDRQAVISFDDNNQKNVFYNNINNKYQNLVNNLSNQNAWKTKKSFGDELDLLAIGPDKELVCIELKTGVKDKNFYFAPLQAAVYCEAFKKLAANKNFLKDIRKMIEQKIDVGLLPKTALKRLPQNKFEVKSCLLIMNARSVSLDSAVWERLSSVINSISNPFKPLVWAIP